MIFLIHSCPSILNSLYFLDIVSRHFKFVISKNIFPWNRNCSLWVTVVCLARLNMSNWFFYLGKYVLYYIYKIFANCSFGLIYLKRILMINLLSSAISLTYFKSLLNMFWKQMYCFQNVYISLSQICCCKNSRVDIAFTSLLHLEELTASNISIKYW